MRTKEEILDTIDGLGAECYSAETLKAQALGRPAVAPGAALVEAMKPIAETLLDLRDLLMGLTVGEDGQIIRQYIAGQLRLQKQDTDWKATIVSRLIAEIRAAGDVAHMGAAAYLANCQQESEQAEDDAERSEGSPHGDGRPDQDPPHEGDGS